MSNTAPSMEPQYLKPDTTVHHKPYETKPNHIPFI